MSEKCLAVVEVNQDLCSRCYVCQSICPYEAIKRDEEGKVNVNIQDCQVCGICYSACPASAIKMQYYTYDNLTDYLKQAQAKAPQTETLVLMCRGNSPNSCGNERHHKPRHQTADYHALRLPAGRDPTDFIPSAHSGVKNIVPYNARPVLLRRH